MTSNLPALQNTAATPSLKPSDYVSVFEAPERFDQIFRLAELLARSSFVPQSFQGKPDDCLIALDLAMSLGLKPTSLFPELYVIDGRPALSSKFLIALVNRSGKFSRIEWAETVDGETEATFSSGSRKYNNYKEYKQKVPNYSAKAFFTENATGKTFVSPVVDVKFADKNGWTTKPGSKWQTMPSVMCRYRSAAFLIKQVAPELVFGWDFAEDVADGVDAPLSLENPPAVLTVAPTAAVAALDEFEAAVVADETVDDATNEERFAELIASAETLDALTALAPEIAAAGLDAAATNRLRAAFAERRKQIATAAQTPPAAPTPAPESTPEQAPKKTVKKKTVTKAAKTPDSASDDPAAVLTQKLDAAGSVAEICALAAESWRTEWNNAPPEQLREPAAPFLRALERVGVNTPETATKLFIDAITCADTVQAVDAVCAFGSPLWPLSTLNIDKKKIREIHLKKREELVDLEEEKEAETLRAEIADEVARGDASELIKKIFDAPNETALNKLFCAYTDGDFGAMNDKFDTAFEMRFADFDFQETEDPDEEEAPEPAKQPAEDAPKVPATEAQNRCFADLMKRIGEAKDKVDIGKIRDMIIDADQREKISVRQVESLSKMLDERAQKMFF